MSNVNGHADCKAKLAALVEAVERCVLCKEGCAGCNLRLRNALAAARTGPNCGACDDKGCHVCHPSMYPAPAQATCAGGPMTPERLRQKYDVPPATCDGSGRITLPQHGRSDGLSRPCDGCPACGGAR